MMEGDELCVSMVQGFERVLTYVKEQLENDDVDQTALKTFTEEMNQCLQNLWDSIHPDEQWTPSPVQITLYPKEKERDDGEAVKLAEMALESANVPDIILDNMNNASAMPIVKSAVAAEISKREISGRKLEKYAKRNFPLLHVYQSRNERLGLFFCKCRKSFDIKSLKNHLYYYTNDRKFHCDYCCCSFPYISLLIKHLKWHKIKKSEAEEGLFFIKIEPPKRSARLAAKSDVECVTLE